jgi:hypothetical protein
MLSNDFGERAEKWRPRIPAQASSNSNQKDRKNGHTPQRGRDSWTQEGRAIAILRKI